MGENGCGFAAPGVTSVSVCMFFTLVGAQSGATSTPAAPQRTCARTTEHVGEAWGGSLWSGCGVTALHGPHSSWSVLCGVHLLCGGPLLSMPCSVQVAVGSDMGRPALLGPALMPRHLLPSRAGKQFPGQRATSFNGVCTQSVRHPSSTGEPVLQLTAHPHVCTHTHRCAHALTHTPLMCRLKHRPQAPTRSGREGEKGRGEGRGSQGG